MRCAWHGNEAAHVSAPNRFPSGRVTATQGVDAGAFVLRNPLLWDRAFHARWRQEERHNWNQRQTSFLGLRIRSARCSRRSRMIFVNSPVVIRGTPGGAIATSSDPFLTSFTGLSTGSISTSPSRYSTPNSAPGFNLLFPNRFWNY